MKFGLFGGAKSAGEGSVGDSLGYRKYIDYVLSAEELGYHSVFVVEHHFTGVGQLSASLNFLSYLAGRTSRIRLGTAVVVLPWHNPVLLAEQVATARPAVQRPLRLRRRQGLPAAGVRGLLHPHRGGNRAVRRDHGLPAQGMDRRRPLLAPWQALALREHRHRAAPRPAAASAAVDGRGQLRVDPACGARGLQSAARPDRAGRPDHRARGGLPGGAWQARAAATVPGRSAWRARCRSCAPRRSGKAPMRCGPRC